MKELIFSESKGIINKDLFLCSSVYFWEITYNNYLRIRIKLSKNQSKKMKFIKNYIPAIPLNKKILSNFSYKSFNQKRKYKNNGYHKINIGNEVFIMKLLSDTSIKNNSDLTKIKKVFIDAILNY